MLDSLKTVLHAGKMPECFGVVKSTSRFFRRPPSVNSPQSCREASRPPEVSVPPKKQRFLARKWIRKIAPSAYFLTRFKSSMEAKPSRGRKTASGCKQGAFRQKIFVNDKGLLGFAALETRCRTRRLKAAESSKPCVELNRGVRPLL